MNYYGQQPPTHKEGVEGDFYLDVSGLAGMRATLYGPRAADPEVVDGEGESERPNPWGAGRVFAHNQIVVADSTSDNASDLGLQSLKDDLILWDKAGYPDTISVYGPRGAEGWSDVPYADIDAPDPQLAGKGRRGGIGDDPDRPGGRPGTLPAPDRDPGFDDPDRDPGFDDPDIPRREPDPGFGKPEPDPEPTPRDSDRND